MKIIVPSVIVSLTLLILPGAVQAGAVWDNGPITGAGTQCDFVGTLGLCGGDGFTIADNFSLSNDTTVTGFTYDSSFVAGAPQDYSTTNWAIYDGDPAIFGAGALVASGSAVASLSTDSCGSPFTCSVTTFAVSGISVDIQADNEYWLTYENVLTDDAETVDVYTLGNAVNPIPGYEELDDQSSVGDSTYDSGDTAFTIDTPSPEPGSFWLAALAASACFLKSRIRR